MRDLAFAESVARFGKINSVYEDIGSLIENVDGIILTNDEPVGRESILNICLDSGKLVFVDKIIARTSEFLKERLIRQQYPGQLYCASAFSFSDILEDIEWDPSIEYMIFSSPKNWSNYGIHVVDLFLTFASLNNLEYEIGKLTHTKTASERQLIIRNSGGKKILLRTEGHSGENFSIKYSKNGALRTAIMSDPFNAFAKMLETWLTRVPEDSHNSEVKRYDQALAILGFERE